MSRDVLASRGETAFQAIRERVLRLCSATTLAPVGNNRELERIGAAAARLYAERAHRGVAGFDPQFVEIQEPRFPDDESQLEKLYALSWTTIVRCVSKETPGLSLTPGAYIETERFEQEDILVCVKEYSPELWRERAEDYAAVLNELSRRTGEQPPSGTDIDPAEHAMAVLLHEPEISPTELAKRVGVSRGTLYKTSKKWIHIRQTLKARDPATVPKGCKDEDGNIEAEAEYRESHPTDDD